VLFSHTIPRGGLRTEWEKLEQIAKEIESPSHPVGLERLLFRIAKEELVELPSHTVGSELNLQQIPRRLRQFMSPSHPVGLEQNRTQI
jgi:hypothetical protein